MKNRLMPICLPLLLSVATGMASEADDGILVQVELGMSEAEVLELYPESKVSVDGTEMTLDGRYGDFLRGDQEFHNGLAMYKLRPSGLDSRSLCKSFFDKFKPRLTGQHGAPAPGSESASDESTFGAWASAWQAPGLFIRLEANWYEEQKTCVAEIFVRPTDTERL